MKGSLESYPYYRYNLIWLVIDFIAFGTAMAFVNVNTVLPSFVNELTDSALLVGLISTLISGSWLLPQLIAANYLADKPRKKFYILLPAALGRPVWWILGGMLLVVGGRAPTLILVAFFAGLMLFMGTDGLAAVAWFDVFSKSVPAERRGRVVGASQIASGIAGVGVGWLVGRILGTDGPPFPTNYALLFFLCGFSLLVSWLALNFLREPVLKPASGPKEEGNFLRRLVGVLRTNRQFRQVTIVRLLFGLGGIATPFYMVYGTNVLKLPPETVGLATSAQVLGGILAGVGLGYIQERWGSRLVILCSTALGLGMPLLALLTQVLALQGAALSLLIAVYASIFVTVGLVNSSIMLGFINFVMELAPPHDNPTYMGLSNALTGLLLLNPVVGGWILEVTSYTVLFALAAAGAGLGLALAFGLREPRQAGNE
ncbi:MAG: MFS transporter [Anaerolineae bacterium]|jgi:MFS family permease|nr:MFS transporter [Anaerolineae bacterium]